MMTFIYLQNVTPLAVNQTDRVRKVKTMTWDFESQNLDIFLTTSGQNVQKFPLLLGILM